LKLALGLELPSLTTLRSGGLRGNPLANAKANHWHFGHLMMAVVGVRLTSFQQYLRTKHAALGLLDQICSHPVKTAASTISRLPV
jgi:hypothetical protein